MPLSPDNCLLAAVFRFGSDADDEVVFPCHLDSCAAMNAGSLTLHQWIITTYPAIVASYKQFDDAIPFQPIGLDCAVPSANSSAISNQLTAVVMYKTRYVDKAGTPMELSFGLGKAIKVNGIIGLPTFKTWKLILDLEENRATSKTLGVYFDLCFEHAAKGLPQKFIFDSTNFVQPPRPNSTGLALLTQCTEALSSDEVKQLSSSLVIVNISNGSYTL